MTLNGKQLEAAELMARGLNDVEISKEINKTRIWVGQLRNNEEFLMYEQSVRENMVENAREMAVGNQMQDIQNCRRKARHVSDKIHNLSLQLLDKFEEKIKLLDADEIKGASLASNLKATCDALKFALDVDYQLLGVDKLLQELNEIKKASGNPK